MNDLPEQHGVVNTWQFGNPHGPGTQDPLYGSDAARSAPSGVGVPEGERELVPERPGFQGAHVNVSELPGYPRLWEQIRRAHLGVPSHEHRGGGLARGGMRAVVPILMAEFPGRSEEWYEHVASGWIAAVEQVKGSSA